MKVLPEIDCVGEQAAQGRQDFTYKDIRLLTT
jgi:hypothetical protein